MRSSTNKYNVQNPFTKAPAASPSTAPVVEDNAHLEQKSYSDSVVDLTKEIARPSASANPPAQEPVVELQQHEPAPVSPAAADTITDDEPAQQSTVQKGTATLEEDFKTFKEKTIQQLQADLNRDYEDPKRAVKNSLKFINMLRTLAYPFMYKKVLFTDADNDYIAKLVLHMQQLSEAKQEIKLDMYQQSMWKRWNDYQSHVSAVPWTEQEIDLITDVGYLKLAQMQLFKTLMENELLMVLLFIEGRRLVPVAGSKLGIADLGSFLKMAA